ncbi:hypothetical protein BGZ83_001361 [Gryganskiella cystojenkinii]|nr:hypothetical protein BGZ83_001361 [Gryganskiella cystojenkinii]
MNPEHPTDSSSQTVQGHSSESTVVDIDPVVDPMPPPPKYTQDENIKSSSAAMPQYAPPSVPPPPLDHPRQQQPRYAPPSAPPPPLNHAQPQKTYAPPSVPPPPLSKPSSRPPQSYGTSYGIGSNGLRNDEASPLLGRSYGAVSGSNNSSNNNIPRRFPQGTWTNRGSIYRNNIPYKWRQRFSACLCFSTIIALFVAFVFWCDCFHGACEVPEDAPIIRMNQTINADLYPELVFHLDRGITGNIAVSRSRNKNDKDILILMSMQASTPEMLGNMTSSLELNPRTARAESRIFMNMTQSALEKALRRNCTRVNVEIVFPADLPEYRSIEINSNHRGDVRVRLDEIYLTHKLSIKTKRGNVEIRDTIVERGLQVQAGGSIRADVEAEDLVEMVADSSLRLKLASFSSGLIVKVRSGRDAAVYLSQPFRGNFLLKSSSHDVRPSVWGPPCCTYIDTSKSDNYTLKGYVSNSGWPPGYTPRIEIRGGTARLDISN